MYASLSERIRRKTQAAGPDECWDWSGSKDQHGYAQIRGEDQRLTRVSRLLAKAGKGQVGMHTCNNSWCVNPKHCIAGSYQTNNIDALRDGLRTGVTAPKLTMEQVREIRAADGSTSSLASQYGVSYSVMYDVLARKTYRHDHSREEAS